MDKQQIYEKLVAFKKDAKKITIDTYATRIYTLVKNGIDLEYDSITKFMNEKEFTYKTKRSYYTSIWVYLSAINQPNEAFKNCIKSMGDQIVEEDKENVLTDTQTLVKNEEIQQILDKQKELLNKTPDNTKGYFKLLQRHLILNLYSQIPPVRNDYVSVSLIDDGGNYISLETGVVYLRKYKTDQKYGVIEIPIPKKLLELIKKVIAKRKEIYPELNTTAFLINEKLKRMTKTNMIQALNFIFNKKVSITMLRKSYISEKYASQYTIKDMEKDAKIMGHSVSMQQSTYRKM